MTENLGGSPAVTCDARRGGSAKRQARYRARLRQRNLIPTTSMVPIGAVPDLQEIAEALQGAPHLRPGPLRDPISGKLVSVKTARRAAARQ